MLEEWEYHAGSRLKSVIILGLVLLVAVQFADERLAEEQLAEERLAEEGLNDELILQTKLEQAESDFHEAVELLAADNSLAARYTQEAESCYQQYAEAMSWALVYYQGTQDKEFWKEDLIRQKAVRKEELLREQSDLINNYLKLRKE